MAITVQRLASQEGSVNQRDSEVALEWFVKATGADKFDEVAVELAVLTAAPLTYAGLGQRIYSIQELGNGVYLATTTYRLLEGQPVPEVTGGGPAPPPGTPGGPPPPPAETAPLDETYSFRTHGGTVHITQSRETMSRTRRGGGDAPNFERAINVNGGRVEGTDILTGNLQFSMTKRIPQVDLAYIKELAALSSPPSWNEATFYHFPAATVLFLGAAGQATTTADAGGWSVTFDFVFSPTLEDIEICADLTVPVKRGWDYLWVLYRSVETEGSVGREPEAAYVEEVYPRSDFRRLRIG